MAYRKPGAKNVSKDLAKELHNQLTAKVAELVSSNGWANLLLTLAEKNGTEIGRYSFSNMLLIWVQLPSATAVCSYKAWGERGRQVLKGSKSLRINAPMNIKDKDENGKVAKDQNGNEKTRVFFKMIPVFDVSQTEPTWQNGGNHLLTITPALPRPRSLAPITGDVPAGMWDDLAGQITQLGYAVERGDTGSANGYTQPKTMTVRVSDAIPEGHAHKTLAHELGHVMFDHVSDMAEYQAHQGRWETEAESFAFMVSAYYGLDSSAYSAPYIGHWAGETPEEILKTVQETGNRVLKAFRSYLRTTETPEAEQVAQEASGELQAV